METVVNGVCLAYEDRGTGPAVLLIHGFPLDRRMWQSQIPALVQAGYRVVVPDLRGMGESALGDGEATMDNYADDMAALLDDLGIDKAVVVGMSMGGYVLFNLLERHRPRVQGAVFVVTRAAAEDAAARRLRTRLAREVETEGTAPLLAKMERAFWGQTCGSTELEQEVAGWMRSADPHGLSLALRAMRDRRDYRHMLPQLQLPCLVVGADQDSASAQEHSWMLSRGLKNSSTCILASAGHLVNLEQPEQFNTCLLEFLDGLCRERLHVPLRVSRLVGQTLHGTG